MFVEGKKLNSMIISMILCLDGGVYLSRFIKSETYSQGPEVLPVPLTATICKNFPVL